MTKVILPPIQSTVRIRKQNTILIFSLVSSGLVTHLEPIYVSTRASRILVLTVWYKVINFSCRIFSRCP
jgi:hypothetical protein